MIRREQRQANTKPQGMHGDPLALLLRAHVQATLHSRIHTLPPAWMRRSRETRRGRGRWPCRVPARLPPPALLDADEALLLLPLLRGLGSLLGRLEYPQGALELRLLLDGPGLVHAELLLLSLGEGDGGVAAHVLVRAVGPDAVEDPPGRQAAGAEAGGRGGARLRGEHGEVEGSRGSGEARENAHGDRAAWGSRRARCWGLRGTTFRA
mmetsp:Transcript_15284/g.48153  ORF Transcript_15284/g.48153 Transcript_15284/m.48153 type:complete len:209 (+) Transcript_15284:16-642(+)